MGSRGRKSAAELAIVRLGTPRVIVEDPEPPRPLGPVGRAMWDKVVGQYDFSDALASETLAQCCAAADLAETTDDAKLQLQARAFVARTLQRLCDE